MSVALLAVPAAAQAADAEFHVTALVERDDAGKPVPHEIRPGESAPVTLGVGNRNDTEFAGGVLVNIRVLNDLNLPREFTNCYYYKDSNLDGAWCQIDQTLEPGGRYQLARFQVALEAKQTEKPGAIIFRWYPKSYGEGQGGIHGLALRDGDKQRPPAPGADGVLLLESRDLPVPADPNPLGFAYVKVITPSTPPTEPILALRADHPGDVGLRQRPARGRRRCGYRR
ncbi:hypothetical protein [Actinoplanes sp. NPDC089786]|uniref:hypothetical protein n=1 Tax=Actinoplanes sp. NPDC089786 TaxID=3155185 RepID=UPI00341DDA2E